ncbi:MAG: hypothetical protein ACLR23_15500 [Clostridia bacterium]
MTDGHADETADGSKQICGSQNDDVGEEQLICRLTTTSQEAVSLLTISELPGLGGKCQ